MPFVQLRSRAKSAKRHKRERRGAEAVGSEWPDNCNCRRNLRFSPSRLINSRLTSDSDALTNLLTLRRCGSLHLPWETAPIDPSFAMPDAKRDKKRTSRDHKLFTTNNHGDEQMALAPNHFNVVSRYNTFDRDYGGTVITPFTVQRMANGQTPHKFESEVKLSGSDESNESNSRQLSTEFGSICTLHGVKDLYRANTRPLTIIWCLAIAATLGAALSGCANIISEYVASPLGVSYFVREGEQRNLPDVVVCPFNRFNKSYLDRHNISVELIEYVQKAFGMNTPYLFQRQQKKKSNVSSGHNHTRELEELLERLQMTFVEFIEAASFPCNSLIRFCVAHSGSLGRHDCCADAQPVLMVVGMCYRIRGVKQVHSGYTFGLTIVLKVPDDDYLSPGISNLQNDGVSIKLAESGKGLDFDLTFIPSGFHALMPLRATLFEFINDSPRYECLSDVNASYSPTSCFDQCFFTHAVETCKCRTVATMVDSVYPPCKPDELYSCFLAVMKKTFKNNPNILNDCREGCRPPCTYWQYQPTASYNKFPSTAMFKYVPEDEQHLWQKFIVLDVFYEKLEYGIVRHVPTNTPQTFISHIGGQIGLWVGGSILTLVQFLVFGWRKLWAFLLSRVKSNKKTNNNEFSTQLITLSTQLTLSSSFVPKFGAISRDNR